MTNFAVLALLSFSITSPSFIFLFRALENIEKGLAKKTLQGGRPGLVVVGGD